ncbi:prepilin-type N-terminal cleavage/methylation domain-containing protein [Caproiciproducens faecalis]|uniref:Prepilin-type N-terminal cleavage/methylation domain-containing protein n=1 Tax=Caproiciproducens faecalis TaxID=2820301 RepID=A0ABS7DJS1_9FIRM|nr:prepilin-type N-terminal cleavage/methylation domain-containing protein [Caproiciproducens faecalis]MBW7571554.1 prepilin-type N-terminal cleavage/methylation domain-containing protein [Caproiciproducens faecalis]
MVKTLRKNNKKGFTLVELVIVIAILAILAAIAIPTVSNVISTANTNVDKANAQTVELALKSAQAEATAKTWDVDADTVTVKAALEQEGIPELPTIKTSGNYRIRNGKVKISANKDDGVKIVMDTTTTLKSVLENKDAES